MVSGSIGETILPSILPIFVVPSAVVLPHGRMPLMVFEPRYLALVDDALGQGRMFGLIQPDPMQPGPVVDLHKVGTLVRIVGFGETGDGRYLITIHGINRFTVVEEHDQIKGYRRITVSYGDFPTDITEPVVSLPERTNLIDLVKTHLGNLDMAGDWDALATLSDDQLVDRLAMACPFNAHERQALLEALDHKTRCSLMIALLQRELINESGPATIH